MRHHFGFQNKKRYIDNEIDKDLYVLMIEKREKLILFLSNKYLKKTI